MPKTPTTWSEDIPEGRTAETVSLGIGCFGEAAELAAGDKPQNTADPLPAMAAAKRRYEQEDKAIRKRIKNETGFLIGRGAAWAYKEKHKHSYALPRRTLTLFLDTPQTLDWKPAQLVEHLAAHEANYTVTRDMLYDKLNRNQIAEANRLLKTRGIPLALTSGDTIRSIQKALKERRDAPDKPADKIIDIRIVDRGDTATVTINGRSFDRKVQTGTSGKRRIRIGGDWLNLGVGEAV